MTTFNVHRGHRPVCRLHRLVLRVLCCAALAFACTSSLRAVPYASGISNNAGTVSFILNESADSVRVTLDPGGTVLDLGALAKGTHSFSLGAATSFQIAVRKIAALDWALISDDTNTLLQFNAPRGVAVNMNAASPYFGRIYVANSAAAATGTGRVVGDGIYLLNADQSDAVGRGNTASTGGITFDTVGGTGVPGANSPWRLEVGPDSLLYIADFSTNTACIYRTDPDVSDGSGVNVLAGTGWSRPTSMNSVHTTIGSSPVIRGSLTTGDLVVWATDGRQGPSGSFNALRRWDINAGPLPYGNAPTPLANPLIGTVFDVTTDLDRGPDGKFYMMQNRSAGNESGVVVVDTDGVTVLWRSLTETRAISNNPSATDILRISRAVKVSPDGTKLSIIRDDSQTWVIPLLNGLPDLTNRVLVPTHAVAPVNLGRDICWDAAGNLYTVSSGDQLLRVFSPGGATVATTASDGTFSVVTEQYPVVSVVATDPVTAESAFDPGTFFLTRTGDTAQELTVYFTLSGDASNEVDYLSVSNSITFAAGAADALVRITPIDDAVAELTESVIFRLAAGTNYAPGVANTARIDILDDEYPNVLTVTALDTNAFERFTNDAFSFRITRFGKTNLEEITVDLALSGTAVEGLDYSAITASVTIPPGAVARDVTLTPLDDLELEGDETIVVTIVDGVDYTAGTPSQAVNRIRDDEWTPGSLLFEDRFETDTSADWVMRFGANNGIFDATNAFAYDYVAAGIPLAPHSAAGTSRGLLLAVNKYNGTAGGSAGINLYPAGRSFSGDFLLRFDMYLSFGTAGTTEHALAGLNHSTSETNRVTQSADANNTTAGGDGVWVAIETDGSANRDYTAYTTTNAANPPAIIASRSATSMAPFVTAPPYAAAGSPGVNATSGKEWSSVELSQIGGVVTLRVNASTVFSFTNNTGYASGDIMLGMNDQFDSVGSPQNFVIFDNVEVLGLGAEIRITKIEFISPTEVAIDFISPGGGMASDFHLQKTDSLSPLVWGDDDNATIVATANGFRATAARSNGERYYRIRR